MGFMFGLQRAMVWSTVELPACGSKQAEGLHSQPDTIRLIKKIKCLVSKERRQKHTACTKKISNAAERSGSLTCFFVYFKVATSKLG